MSGWLILLQSSTAPGVHQAGALTHALEVRTTAALREVSSQAWRELLWLEKVLRRRPQNSSQIRANRDGICRESATFGCLQQHRIRPSDRPGIAEGNRTSALAQRRRSRAGESLPGRCPVRSSAAGSLMLPRVSTPTPAPPRGSLAERGRSRERMHAAGSTRLKTAMVAQLTPRLIAKFLASRI